MRNSIAMESARVKPMDEVAQRLREDAARIDASVSPELETRIRASLQNVSPESAQKPRPRRSSLNLWWASSLTGAAAAAIVIIAIRPAADDNNTSPQVTAPEPLVVPILRSETAMLTAPLEQELENLEADLRKAEQAVRRDFGLEP